jgi:ubiquinone/menaquinone biosynthesis C-methylase UbiE
MAEPHHHAGHSSRHAVDAERLLNEIGLGAGNVMVDAGCGDGYISIAASSMVGPSGTVWALDMDASSLERLTRELYVKGLGNIKVLNTDLSERLPLPDAIADSIVMVNVLHGLSSEGRAEATLMELRRILKRGGKMLIVDFEKKFTLFGPPKDIRLDPAEVEALASRAGFKKVRQFEAASSAYGIIFE